LHRGVADAVVFVVKHGVEEGLDVRGDGGLRLHDDRAVLTHRAAHARAHVLKAAEERLEVACLVRRSVRQRRVARGERRVGRVRFDGVDLAEHSDDGEAYFDVLRFDARGEPGDDAKHRLVAVHQHLDHCGELRPKPRDARCRAAVEDFEREVAARLLQRDVRLEADARDLPRLFRRLPPRHEPLHHRRADGEGDLVVEADVHDVVHVVDGLSPLLRRRGAEEALHQRDDEVLVAYIVHEEARLHHCEALQDVVVPLVHRILRVRHLAKLLDHRLEEALRAMSAASGGERVSESA